MLWPVLGIAAILAFGWGTYTVRNGRRYSTLDNMLGGAVKGLLLLPLVLLLILIGYWLGFDS